MYYILFALCYLVSLLPMWALYLVSDAAYLLLYRVVGYRKKVVTDNLAGALGELPLSERRRITRAFYHNLADTVAETIKLFSISEKALARRFTGDLSLLRQLGESGRSCQVHLGHYFNWEWANVYISSQVRTPFLVTYMPLKSPVWNRLIRRLRSRMGSVLISAKDVARDMKPWQHRSHISVLVADQNPGKIRRAYWFPFLGRMTPFYKGPELSARRGDHAVIYGEISKTGRGRYHIDLRLVSDHPASEPEGAVTGCFVRLLEAGIRAQPENWVWSHRRWKRTWDGKGEAPPF